MALKFEQIVPNTKFVLVSDVRNAINIDVDVPLYLKLNDVDVVNLGIGYVCTLTYDTEIITIKG